MSKLNLKYEDYTLDKWAEREIGVDNLQNIKENPYISGDAKRVLNYIFDNFLDPEFSKIIDLNLGLDDEFKSEDFKISIDEDNIDLISLKIKYLELKKEKFDLERINSENNRDIDTIIDSLMEKHSSQSSIDNLDVLKKNTELMLIEDEFEKKKLLKAKVDKANQKLIPLLDKQVIEISEIEDIINSFKFKNIKNLDMNDEKLNLFALSDYFGCFDSKTKDEISKLNHILDEETLKNEVDLLKYQNTNEFTLSNLQSLNEAINQELLNMIVLSTQSFQFETNKIKNDESYEMLLKILKKNRINKYYRDYLGLYGRYFKSYVTLKKTLCEFNELNTIFEQLKSEKDFYRNSFLAITKRFDRIKSMELKIHEKQIQIEDIFYENLNFFNQKIQLDLDKLKISWDQLVDIFRIFNSSNSIMNSTRNDSTCPNDSKQNKVEFYKQNFYQFFNNEEHNKQDEFDLKIKLAEELLNIKKRGKTKSFLIPALSDIVLDISCKIKAIESMNENKMSHHEMEKSFGDLDTSLNDCKATDKYQITAFLNLIEEKIGVCELNCNSMIELSDLLLKWSNQPGAFDCSLENYTVNSKNLDYYIEYIDELIKEKP